ncbi:unnamed protein product [Closterium sp. Naga37s-1]|nr:unnamed protein product [Closterium sp. Naga37s-1]
MESSEHPGIECGSFAFQALGRCSEACHQHHVSFLHQKRSFVDTTGWLEDVFVGKLAFLLMVRGSYSATADWVILRRSSS